MSWAPCSSLFGVLMSVIRFSIRTEAGKKNPTAAQCSLLQEHRTALLKRLRRFRRLQTTFMPGLQAYLDGVLPSLPLPTNSPSSSAPLPSTLDDTAHPEVQPLYLPSELCSDDRLRICIQGLPTIEERLREAHVMEELQELQAQLRMRSFMSVHKQSNIRSQGPYTRMRSLQQQVEQKVTKAAVGYR